MEREKKMKLRWSCWCQGRKQTQLPLEKGCRCCCCCCCCVASVVSDSVRPHRRQPIRLPCPWDSPGTGEGQYLVTEGLSPITTSNWILPKSKRSLEEDPRLQLRTTVWSTLDYSLMEPEQRFHLSCAWIPDPQNCEIIDVCFFKVLYVYPFVIHQKKKKKHKSSLTILTQIYVFPLGVPIPFIHSSNLHILRLTTCYTLW